MNNHFKVTTWVCDYAIKNNINEIIVLYPIRSRRIALEICKLLNEDYESGLEK